MKSSRSSQTADSGRPMEIEEPSNRFLIHPLARTLVDRLVGTAVTPDQVSMASVLAAAGAAICYFTIAPPLGALAALPLQIVWHVLDGADGNLARRTGRASAHGELVDGICDHLSQALIYLAFAGLLSRSIGPWAWLVALAAALSHFVQANAYENGRKTYRRWVYGAAWMRQSLATLSAAGPLSGLIGRLYVALATLTDGGEARVEAAMAPLLAVGGPPLAQARERYGELKAPEVRASAILGGNMRTFAGFASMLSGSPIWYFAFEIVVLNLALAVVILARFMSNRTFVDELANPKQARQPRLGP